MRRLRNKLRFQCHFSEYLVYKMSNQRGKENWEFYPQNILFSSLIGLGSFVFESRAFGETVCRENTPFPCDTFSSNRE